jgi:hypothetical protein
MACLASVASGSSRRLRFRLVYLTAVLVTTITTGCGGSANKVGQLKGKVMFKGQPVPAGYISFTPDASKGNQGSVKVAQIKDGLYDTSLASDPGVIPGPNIIRIAGFDGKVVPRFGQGKQIFNPHELRHTLAEGADSKDFTIPDSAADNLRIEPTSDN